MLGGGLVEGWRKDSRIQRLTDDLAICASNVWWRLKNVRQASRFFGLGLRPSDGVADLYRLEVAPMLLARPEV
jgi:hypothetical protein